MEDQLLEVMSSVFNYAPIEVVINSLVAFILGLFIAHTYKETHQGLSYSQSFVLTIIFVTIIIFRYNHIFKLGDITIINIH